MFDKARANDKDYVLEVVRQNGHALQYASDELKNDKDVVQNNEDIIEAILAAANGNTEALQYVDPADEYGNEYDDGDIGDDDPGDIGDWLCFTEGEKYV